MDNPAHGEAAWFRYGKATVHNGERILRGSGRRGEKEIVAQTAELEGISNGRGRVRPASRGRWVRPKQRAWRALGPARLRGFPRSRGAGAHAAGARGVLADQRRLAGHPGRHQARRRCPAAGRRDTIETYLVSCRGRAEPGDLRGAHWVERQGGGSTLRRFCEGRLEEYPRGEGCHPGRVALSSWVGEAARCRSPRRRSSYLAVARLSAGQDLRMSVRGRMRLLVV